MQKKEIIPVVVACIVDQDKGRVLLHRKNEAADERGIPRNPELCGKWEFPGGMMEYGEDPIPALRREIREECGREILVLRLLLARTNIFEDGQHYLILYYLCKLSGDADIDGSQWFTIKEVRHLDAIPGTDEIIELFTMEGMD